MSLALAPSPSPHADSLTLAAEAVRQRLASDHHVTATDLFAIMTDAFGAKRGDAVWTTRHAFDVSELGCADAV